MITDEKQEKLETFLDYTLSVSHRLQKLPEKELLDLLLKYSDKKLSIIPELSEILNLSQIIKLLYVFAGQTLEIPKQSILNNALRDLDVYYTVKYSTNLEQDSLRLSTNYSLTEQAMTAIYNKVDSKLNNY